MKRNAWIQIGFFGSLGVILMAVWLVGKALEAPPETSQANPGSPNVIQTVAGNLGLPTRAPTSAQRSTPSAASSPRVQRTAVPLATRTTQTVRISPTVPPAPVLRNPAQWQAWPIIPVVSPKLREIYQKGIAQGNNPHAFSFLGDCQSQPDVFMGIFDQDPAAVESLPDELQETVAHFAGSFNRYSPTVKDGTTEGALLWIQWNDNLEKKCTNTETPLDCELRVHKPSIVFIHVGTHYEDRNRRYLETILDKILARNAIPVFVTKADNVEKDFRINQMLATLAAEYDLPMWNFWASVQHLPNKGLKVEDPIYLTDEGIDVHRMGGLDAVNAVWRALR
jgi:hypothetical protein